MKKLAASPKVWRVLEGGPWHGHKVLIPTQGGTMVFTIGEHRGRYDEFGRWQAVSDDNRPAASAG